MKKIIVLLFALFMLCGCGIKGGNLDDIKKRGYIVVGMEGNWAPWTYHDEQTKELVGYDVEVGKIIAESLGVDVKFVEGKWDGLLAGVKSGRYDLMINGCDVTEERKQAYDFSIPYSYGKVAVIVRSDDDRIQVIEDLKDKTTANTITSTYAQFAKEYGVKEVKGVDDLARTFELLERGDIDATLNAETSYADYMAVHPEAKFKIACYYPEVTEVAIPIKKGSDEFLKEVNKALNEAQSNGKLKEASIKYFGIDTTKNEN